MQTNPAEKASSSEKQLSRWRWRARETRMLVYLVILLGVAGWRYLPRPWHPLVTVETMHYLILSSATRQQAQATGHVLDILYEAYSNRWGVLPDFQRSHPRLKIKLFKDHAEFRWINPNLGWAEAFYREPYCRAYFSSDEVNPYHWMLHESVHQLNHEVAHLKLEKWLEEGSATYFSTSLLKSNELAIGRIDANTYPVWWIDDLATSPDLSENIRNGSVIPLRAIITGQGGPGMNNHFNLYYLHWWTLTHFILESPRYRQHAIELVQRGGSLQAFEQIIGPVDLVQTEWHTHVRQLKTLISGEDLKALKAGHRLKRQSAPPQE